MTSTNRECSTCCTSKGKSEYSKNQWLKGIGISKCKVCVEESETSEAVSSETVNDSEIRTCAFCRKQGDKDQFRSKEWKKGAGVSLCRSCSAYTDASPQMERACSSCKIIFPRRAFVINQWIKGDGKSMCQPCFSDGRDLMIQRFAEFVTRESTHVETPDGLLFCEHGKERCDVCFLDFILQNNFQRKRNMLGRDLTNAETEEINTAFFGINGGVSMEICILDNLAVCKRTGRKLRCRCNKVVYCSTDCQKYDWKSHKLTCTADRGKK